SVLRQGPGRRRVSRARVRADRLDVAEGGSRRSREARATARVSASPRRERTGNRAGRGRRGAIAGGRQCGGWRWGGGAGGGPRGGRARRRGGGAGGGGGGGGGGPPPPQPDGQGIKINV